MPEEDSSSGENEEKAKDDKWSGNRNLGMKRSTLTWSLSTATDCLFSLLIQGCNLVENNR